MCILMHRSSLINAATFRQKIDDFFCANFAKIDMKNSYFGISLCYYNVWIPDFEPRWTR